ncbi:uncharacterized protein LOC122263640 [Penaeus japonicus]|uniref:uncharacterized protein LOC122263640 n=1 Tax=Penaeus japonicus TaxID=27405 RepID=UPI001C712C5C|nr:uncharacterized protein LOC122263640 [Penaeus japonicus]
MITYRITWWLETNDKLDKDQTGFRPGKSTIDALQIINLIITKALKEKKFILVACLVLEKAFDSANHEAIIKKAAKIGIIGNPLKWINNFLTNRTFQISIGAHKSSKEKILKGVPQGSPLSPVLFNILMSDLEIPENTKKVIYADDITLISENHDLMKAITDIEQAIKHIKEWTNIWDLKINIKKSKLMCFTNKRIRNIPKVKIDNEELEFSSNHNILGLNFNSPKLKWGKQIQNIKLTTLNRLSIMKKLTSLSWGMSRENLLKFYKIYIKPKIDYGLMIYGNTNNTELKKLESIQNEALRIATGCFKSTPIIALQAITKMLPLKQNIKEQEYIQMQKNLQKQNNSPLKQLTIKMIKTYEPNSTPKNMIHSAIETCKELKLYITTKVIPNITPLPPWFDILQITETHFMDNLSKETTKEIISKQFLMLEKSKYKNHQKIFTDGSMLKEKNSTSAAIYIAEKNITTIWKLPNHTQIIEAELFAIRQGLKYIIENKLTKTVILTDSKSAIQLIANPKPKKYKGITFDIQNLILTLTKHKSIIKIQHIPAHKNIKGNEIVDLAAKKAHNITSPSNLIKDISNIKKETKLIFQNNWEKQLNRILSTKNYYIKNSNSQPWTRSKNRKIDICLTRLKTKHTKLKQHLNRIKIETDPFCRWCNIQEESDEHLFLHCPRFNSNRVKLLEALKKIKIINPTVELLITGGNQPTTKKYYILRHTKIFLQRTKIMNIT